MRALSSILAAALLAGCVSVPDVVWQPVCRGTPTCDPSTLALKEQGCAVPADGRNIDCDATETRNDKLSFKVAYLEYPHEFVDGDAPAPRDPLQLQAILKELRDSKRPLLVSVYVHGWHHNAAPDDDNVRKYPHMLARYAYALQRTGKDEYSVLGIYVGWRGESSKSPFNAITIGNRADAADGIGQTSSLPLDLKQIADAMRAANPQSRMIVMGHSLGGRILSRAFLPAVYAGNSQPLGSGTVIVTANAAIGADAYRALYESSRASAQARTPMWVNFTAKDDAATVRTYREALRFHWLSPDESDERPDTMQTIGHYQPYITHQISIQDCTPSENSMSPCGSVAGLDARAYTDYWRMNAYRLFTLDYGNTLRHCVFMVDYPRSEALEERIRRENPQLCNGVFEKDYDKPTGAARKVPANGRMWNVRVDASVFDFAEPSGFLDFSIHNGYVQTDLTAMLVQLAFERDVGIPLVNK